MLAHQLRRVGRLKVSFFDSSVSDSDVINLPANCLPGDLAVMGWGANNSVSSTPGDVSPSGWAGDQSQVKNHNSISVQGARGKMLSKLLTAADITAGSVTGFNGTLDAKVMFVFRGNRPFAGKTYNAGGGQLTDGDPGAQSANASGGAAPSVVVAFSYTPGGGSGAFTTASPAFDGTVASANTDIIGGYKVYPQSPQDHSYDMGDPGGNISNWLAGGYYVLT